MLDGGGAGPCVVFKSICVRPESKPSDSDTEESGFNVPQVHRFIP